MGRLAARRSNLLRRRAPLLAAFGLVLVLAAISVPPTEALWFQVLSGNISASTGAFPTPALGAGGPPTTAVPTATGEPRRTQTPTRTPRAETTPTPAATPTPCSGDSLADLHFDGDRSAAGSGPFAETVDVSNGGDATARGVMLGFAAIDGWAFVARIDFGNGQSWLNDGHPAATLYSVGDLEPGGTARIALTITMSSAWGETPPRGSVALGARFADLHCPDAEGETTRVTLSHEAEDATETPIPDTTATTTPTAASTATPTQTALATTG